MPLERHTIPVGRHFLDGHDISGAHTVAPEELPDPAALAEELLLAIEVCHDHGRAAPVDGNFALGDRGTV